DDNASGLDSVGISKANLTRIFLMLERQQKAIMELCSKKEHNKSWNHRKRSYQIMATGWTMMAQWS
ncbi:hypothetical protein HAX54_029433, partial [Datura stramonium]|nr:hypothetical protein [Datura stramonium]